MISNKLAYEAGFLAGQYDQPESEYIKWSSDDLTISYMKGIADGIEYRLNAENEQQNQHDTI